MTHSTRARAGAMAAAAVACALIAAPAMAATSVPSAPGQRAAVQPRVSIAITSISPAIATPGATVTVSGIVVNPGAEAVHGPAVQLWSSSTYLANRISMETYLTIPGSTGMDSQVPGAVSAAASVPAHSTWRWTVRLAVQKVHIRAAGVAPLVYPLAAELSATGHPVDADRTFLPFWPGKRATKALKPVRVAWVWPLIDVPQRAACAALLTNDLARSVGPGGRLSQLLADAASPVARHAQVTLAIDPALLSDVSVMTRPYRVGGSDSCAGGATEQASAAAVGWLDRVRLAAGSQGYFVTPYADVDVAALSHQGLNNEMASAFSAGRLTAQQFLGAGHPQSRQVAWPPNGTADYSVIEGLAANHIRTVILDSSLMPAVAPTVTYTPSAVTMTPDGLGTQMHVLLADSTMSRILAMSRGEIPGVVPAPSAWDPSAPGSAPAGLAAAAVFAKKQWFLAETAMIAAEAPAIPRSLVITPPRRWNPPAGMASALLREANQAPWLRPASLASLATRRSLLGRLQLRPPPQHKLGSGELSTSLLSKVGDLSEQIIWLESILNGGERDSLGKAVATVESSAWGGDKAGRHQAKRLLKRVAGYVHSQLQQVQIIDPVHVTLGGKSGAVPVSIRNRLSRPITVRLVVSVPSPGRVEIGQFPREFTIQGRELRTIKIPVRAAAAGSTTLTLQLATPAGTPLPGTATRLTVEATHFGTLAIVIILVALVVFVLTAAGRAIRRGGEPGGGAGQPGEAEESATTAHSPVPGGEADSVVPRGSVTPSK